MSFPATLSAYTNEISQLKLILSERLINLLFIVAATGGYPFGCIGNAFGYFYMISLKCIGLFMISGGCPCTT